MARILCAKSGVQFQVEHFPISFTMGELHHPIFDAPLKRLWKYYPKWQSAELGEVDSYLLFLALLNATELVEFRTAAMRTGNTAQIVASNMQSLVSCIGRISGIKTPRFVLPRFVVSRDTATLGNVKHWIDIWDSQYADFVNGLAQQDLRTKLQKRESALERLIKNPSIKPERYAHLLAQWAAEAAAFPVFTTNIRGTILPLSEYWKDLIIKCYSSIDIIQINRDDLVELIEHCEDNLENYSMGSIFSHQLFSTLRGGLQTIDGFFSIGSPTFSILSDNDDVGESNLQLLINDAPAFEPHRKDYPTEFAYLKARMKWRLASASTPTSTTKITGLGEI